MEIIYLMFALGLPVLVGFFLLILFLIIFKIIVYKIFFRHEIRATLERDPAATGSLVIILTYPGISALFSYRISHIFYRLKFRFIARAISQWSRLFTGIEIHPGAQIGKGLFIDHGMGVVIGETTIIGENVTLFQGVTLGGTGKEKGKRHPTLGNNVVVGAGAKVLGNIVLGDNVSVGANAVVIHDVPANSTVVGVPGRITRREGRRVEQGDVDYCNLPDPLNQTLDKIEQEIQKIEDELKDKKPKS